MAFTDEQLIEVLPALRRYALRLTNDRVAFEDLVQDTVLRMVSAREKFTSGTNFRGWAFTIMHRLFVSQLRAARRRVTVSIYADTGEVAYDTAVEPSGPIVVDLAILAGAMKKLPTGFAPVVMLATAGYSYDEIAVNLDLALGTVRSRLWRARDQLRAVLQ